MTREPILTLHTEEASDTQATGAAVEALNTLVEALGHSDTEEATVALSLSNAEVRYTFDRGRSGWRLSSVARLPSSRRQHLVRSIKMVMGELNRTLGPILGGLIRGEQKAREKDERHQAVRQIAEASGIDLASFPSLSRSEQRDIVAKISCGLAERGMLVSDRTLRGDMKEPDSGSDALS